MTKRISVFLIFIVLLTVKVYSYPAQEVLKIHFIDVGEGDAILFEIPNGETVLIDTGNPITGVRLLEYLNKKEIKRLTHLILTHPHLDHIGGSFYIIQNLGVSNLYDNGQDISGLVSQQDIYRWYEDLVRKNINYHPLSAGRDFLVGAVRFNVFWPPEPLVSSDFNVNSLIIMVEYGDFRCLLAADATLATEQALLKLDKDLTATILKVGHHGASDASSLEFLKAVSPKAAIISVDQANIRGYPGSEVIERLERLGIKVFRTDIDGDVIIVGNREGDFFRGDNQ